MPTSSQDTEITLGTGRMLALFFTFVLVCAVFFAIGFSLGRKTSVVSASNVLNAATAAPATVVRPSAAKDASQPAPQTTDLSFYKSVGAKTVDTDLKTAEPQPVSADPSKAPITPSNPVVSAAPATGGYFVQVAAVSRQEDAEALVQALQKKQYPAFTANNVATDKYYHVQVGPYAELKDAEAMRARLVADGYNPIVKK
jgi:cell division septation protein DedD